jgi:hypothetical protein
MEPIKAHFVLYFIQQREKEKLSPFTKNVDTKKNRHAASCYADIEWLPVWRLLYTHAARLFIFHTPGINPLASH